MSRNALIRTHNRSNSAKLCHEMCQTKMLPNIWKLWRTMDSGWNYTTEFGYFTSRYFYDDKCVDENRPICIKFCKYDNCNDNFHGRHVTSRYRTSLEDLLVINMIPNILPYIEYTHEPMRNFASWWQMSEEHFRCGRVLCNTFASDCHCGRKLNIRCRKIYASYQRPE